MSTELIKAIVELNRDAALAELKTQIQAGSDPHQLLQESQAGMEQVGKRFETGDFFLSELLLSAEIFKYLAAELEPHLLAASGEKKLGKILMATPQGDIHDLGKNIVTLMLKTRGFEVIDLGVDVPVDKIVKTAIEEKPLVVGLSCLLTTVLDTMKQVEGQLRDAGLRDQTRFMIGGGVTNDSTQTYVNADFQSTDVIETVNYCLGVANAA